MFRLGEPRKVAIILWVLLALFILRVSGQAAVAALEFPYLPPMEEWYIWRYPLFHSPPHTTRLDRSPGLGCDRYIAPAWDLLSFPTAGIRTHHRMARLSLCSVYGRPLRCSGGALSGTTLARWDYSYRLPLRAGCLCDCVWASSPCTQHRWVMTQPRRSDERNLDPYNRLRSRRRDCVLWPPPPPGCPIQRSPYTLGMGIHRPRACCPHRWDVSRFPAAAAGSPAILDVEGSRLPDRRLRSRCG